MARIRTGEQAVPPDKPAHIPGVYQGNAKGNYARNAGWLPDGRVTAERSTGVSAKARNPIDPRMPNLPPA